MPTTADVLKIAAGSGLTLGLLMLVAPGPLAPPPPAADAPGSGTSARVTPTTYNPSVSLAPLVEAVKPAVVSVEVSGTRTIPVNPWAELFGRGYGGPRAQPFQSEGSGFVISEDGLVLTNHHVVGDADEIAVVFEDGERVLADVLGSDRQLDVALLKLPADRSWPYVTLGSSEEVRVGDWVVAVGNPLGLDMTVTTGIISGKGRGGASVYQDYLQTDAAINPGNSGGPLFTLDGRVVGMNTAIIAGANTVGFAVPSDAITAIIDDLRTEGRVRRGYLGVMFQPLDDGLRDAMDLEGVDGGVVITDVPAGLPASRAGVRVGDVIVSVDGEHVDDGREFARLIGGLGAGHDVALGILRDGKHRQITATLVERTPEVEAGWVPAPRPSSSDHPTLGELGLELTPVPRSMAAAQGIDGGVLVEAVAAGSPADGVLEPGDVIVRINQRDVRDPAAAESLFARAGDMVSLLIVRGDARRFVVLRKP